jgi:hypothetical protein
VPATIEKRLEEGHVLVVPEATAESDGTCTARRSFSSLNLEIRTARDIIRSRRSRGDRRLHLSPRSSRPLPAQHHAFGYRLSEYSDRGAGDLPRASRSKGGNHVFGELTQLVQTFAGHADAGTSAQVPHQDAYQAYNQLQ